MYFLKGRIFLELSKNQKSDFLAFVRSFVKKRHTLAVDEILDKIIEEIEYFRALGQEKFSYFDLEDEKNLSELTLFIKECKKYYENKVAQKPLYEAQKRIQKEIKARILDEKQKKEEPTKKQIHYYKSLSKRYGLEVKPIEEMSKYDIKLEIQNILENYSSPETASSTTF